WAFWATSASTMPSPSPRLPPVTTIFCPSSVFMAICSFPQLRLGPKTFDDGKRIRRNKKFSPHPLSSPLRLFLRRRHPARNKNKRRTTMQESYERREKNWVLGVTSLASFMMALDSLVITTAFATIRADFGSSVETLQWAV